MGNFVKNRKNRGRGRLRHTSRFSIILGGTSYVVRQDDKFIFTSDKLTSSERRESASKLHLLYYSINDLSRCLYTLIHFCERRGGYGNSIKLYHKINSVTFHIIQISIFCWTLWYHHRNLFHQDWYRNHIFHCCRRPIGKGFSGRTVDYFLIAERL